MSNDSFFLSRCSSATAATSAVSVLVALQCLMLDGGLLRRRQLLCLSLYLRHVEGRMLLLILAVVGSFGGSSLGAIAERACVALYVGPSTLIALRTPTAHHTVVLHHFK